MRKIICIALAGLLSGCTVVSVNRTFPKVSWYWSKDAKMQRQYNKVGRELIRDAPR